MKRLISLSLILLFVAGSILYGQEPDPNAPAQQAARSTGQLTEMLNLNTDQQQAVLCAQEDFFMYRKRLFDQHALTGGASDGMRLQLLHKRENCQQKIFTVLTPVQAEVYQRHLESLKPR